MSATTWEIRLGWLRGLMCFSAGASQRSISERRREAAADTGTPCQTEASLAGGELADPFEQLVEVVLAETLVRLQAFVVEHEAFDDELAQGVGGPDAEAGGRGTVHAVADGDMESRL